jgi:glutathione peroxidase
MTAIKAISSTCKKEWDIVWNFTKFLVDKDWNVVKRYDPTFKPEDMEEGILKLL